MCEREWQGYQARDHAFSNQGYHSLITDRDTEKNTQPAGQVAQKKDSQEPGIQN